MVRERRKMEEGRVMMMMAKNWRLDSSGRSCVDGAGF